MDDETVICECLEITYGEIMESVKNGCKTVECIVRDTQAGTACRQCKSLDDDKKFRRKYHIQEDILDEL